jgi:hypothetical protein
MIEQIKFKAGPSPTSPSLVLDIAPTTVFVGPNNSGKSRVLIELEGWSGVGEYAQSVVIEQVDFAKINQVSLESELESLKVPANPGESRHSGHVYVSRAGTDLKQTSNNSAAIYLPSLIIEATTGVAKGNGAYASYRKLFTLRLDGNSRLGLLAERDAGDFQNAPQNPLTRLFINNELRLHIRRIVYDAFNRYFVLDPTNPGKLRVRLSDRAPITESEERGWDKLSIDYHGQNTRIEETSDGVRAFTGIIAALIAYIQHYQ